MCFISQTGNQSNFLDPQFLSKCISPISYILLALMPVRHLSPSTLTYSYVFLWHAGIVIGVIIYLFMQT